MTYSNTIMSFEENSIPTNCGFYEALELCLPPSDIRDFKTLWNIMCKDNLDFLGINGDISYEIYGNDINNLTVIPIKEEKQIHKLYKRAYVHKNSLPHVLVKENNENKIS